MPDRLSAIAADSARVAELAATVPLDRPVPSCPGWRLSDLVGHLGQVQRVWAATVRLGRADARAEDESTPPGYGLSGWMAESTAELIDALREAGETRPCWTWWAEPRTSGAVARHQVQEAAVHRYDAELAAGAVPAPLAEDVAHDGVAEYLEIGFATDLDGRPVGGLVELASTDTQGRWRAGEEGGRSVGVAGTASDLVLLLYGRIRPEQLAVEGDRALLADFLAIADNS